MRVALGTMFLGRGWQVCAGGSWGDSYSEEPGPRTPISAPGPDRHRAPLLMAVSGRLGPHGHVLSSVCHARSGEGAPGTGQDTVTQGGRAGHWL